MTPKIGIASNRILLLDDSEESRQAVAFMDSTGIAYAKEVLTGCKTIGIRLPAVQAPSGAIFQGLDDIRKYRRAYGLTLSEVMPDTGGDSSRTELRVTE